MKRILSLALTVAMLAALITLTVPVATAGTGGTISFADGTSRTVTAHPTNKVDIDLVVQVELPPTSTHLGAVEGVRATISDHEDRVEFRSTNFAALHGSDLLGATDDDYVTAGCFQLTGVPVALGAKVPILTFHLAALPISTAGWSAGVVRVQLAFFGGDPSKALTMNNSDVHPSTVTYSYIDLDIQQVGTSVAVTASPAAANTGTFTAPTRAPTLVPAGTAGTVNLNAGTPTEGWGFHNWTTAATGTFADSTSPTTTFSHQAVATDASISITANFRPLVVVLPGTHGDDNTGSALTSAATFATAGVLTQALDADFTPTPPTSSNRVFDGWEIVSGDGTLKSNNRVVTVEGPLVIEAQWREPTITVISKGAAGTFGAEIAPGTGLDTPPNVAFIDPAAAGTYHITAGTHSAKFLRWDMVGATVTMAPTATDLSRATFVMPGNADVIATAVWQGDDGDVNANTYIVKVTSEGATGVIGNNGIHKEGDKVTVSAGTREGSTFTGWKVVFPAGTLNSTISAFKLDEPNSPTTTFLMPASNITLIAEWDGEIEDVLVLKPDTAAVLKALDDADACALVLDFTDAGESDNYDIHFPVEIMEAVVALGMDLVAETATVAVKLDTEALIAALEIADDEIVIEVRKTGDTYDIEAVANNIIVIPDFGAGHATVSVPYTLGADENANAIVAVDADDEIVRSMYEDGAVMFITNTFGTFSVIEADSINFSDRDTTSASMYEHAIFVSSRGLFKGYTDGTFKPNGDITYAEMAAVLANMDGQNFVGGYPTRHINWAEEAGVFEGVTYTATDAVTREDMAQMIYNYYQTLGVKVCCDVRELSLSDIDSSYAKDAIQALANKGIISGRVGGYYDPATTITRVEVAAIIGEFVKAFRLCDNVIVVECK